MKTLLALFLLTPSVSLAAACCGGSFSFPSLILGDDKAQITGSYTHATVANEVLASGKWIRRNDGNLSQSMKIDGAILLSDRWQTGFSTPFITKKSNTTQEHAGLGDLSLFLGHETFPELSYSRWKPRGVSFLQVTLPTAPSIYDETEESSQIRGRGFLSIGAGVALMKTWKIWDFNFSADLHHSFSRTASGSSFNGDATIDPGWGTTQTLGLGWNRGDFRLGSSLSFLYEEAISIRGTTSSTGQAQKNFTLAMAGSYMPTPESALTLSYSDQSLIGNPVNSSLSNTINLSYQQRWPR